MHCSVLETHFGSLSLSRKSGPSSEVHTTQAAASRGLGPGPILQPPGPRIHKAAPLRRPTPPRASALLHLEAGGEALKAGGRPSAASQECRATATPPQKKIRGAGAAPGTEASGQRRPFPQANRVPSALRGQKSPEASRARLRPRSTAPPRKEAREAAAPLRRFY